jgi:hypothetical protein
LMNSCDKLCQWLERDETLKIPGSTLERWLKMKCRAARKNIHQTAWCRYGESKLSHEQIEIEFVISVSVITKFSIMFETFAMKTVHTCIAIDFDEKAREFQVAAGCHLHTIPSEN